MKLKDFIKDFNHEIKNNIKSVKKEKSIKKQIPNLLTLSRGIAPIAIIPLALTGHISEALITGGIIASTDFFDGAIARKFNCVSDLGQKLDPICDKLLALSIGIPLIILNPILIINMILELVIATINIKSTLKNNKPASNKIGKLKTWFLSISLLLSYICKVSNFPISIFYSSVVITSFLQTKAAINYKKTDNKKEIQKEEKKQETKELKQETNTQKEIRELKNLKENLLNNDKEKEKVKTLKFK